jgi:hypothetical protein
MRNTRSGKIIYYGLWLESQKMNAKWWHPVAIAKQDFAAYEI